jgi:putative DNA primase/helicase
MSKNGKPQKIDDAITAGIEPRPMDQAEQAGYMAELAELANDIDAILRPVRDLENKPCPMDLRYAIKAVVEGANGMSQVDKACLQSAMQALLKERKVAGAAGIIKAVAAELSTEGASGDATGDTLRDATPCSHPVSGAEVLDEVRAYLSRYVAMSEGAVTCCSLWVFQTYLIEVLDHSGRLSVQSPAPQCGKSTLLTCFEMLVQRALPAVSTSQAVIFRSTEKYQPTLLFDEADQWIHECPDVHGLLNAGYRRHGATVLRCVGDDHDVTRYNVFGAVALASIRRLPAILQTRCLVVSLQRKPPGEGHGIRRMRHSEAKATADIIKSHLARWAADIRDEVAEAVEGTEVPDEVANDRQADIWRPLIALADFAGGSWPERARRAALAISGPLSLGEEEDAGIMLLSDLRDCFAGMTAEHLPTGDLVGYLHSRPDRPWREWSKGRPISPNKVGRLLAGFGIRSRKHRIGDRMPWGYYRADCQEAIERYILSSQPPEIPATPATNESEPGNHAVFARGEGVACGEIDPATHEDDLFRHLQDVPL